MKVVVVDRFSDSKNNGNLYHGDYVYYTLLKYLRKKVEFKFFNVISDEQFIIMDNLLSAFKYIERIEDEAIVIFCFKLKNRWVQEKINALIKCVKKKNLFF